MKKKKKSQEQKKRAVKTTPGIEMKDKIEVTKNMIEKIISAIVGPEGEKLVDLLYDKQNVNEFLIAKKVDMTINQTRNMLYKLADESLISFIRKKDKKKGGWYTYFWTLKTKRALLKFKEDVENQIENLRNQLNSLQKGRYFYCKNCDAEYTEEDAMLHDFTCPECGEVMEMKDTAEIESRIKSKIEKIQETLQKIIPEIQSIEEKEQKGRERRQKLELKKKEIERKNRRMEREKEKAKLKKKEKPKKPKKETPKGAVKKASKKKKKRK